MPTSVALRVRLGRWETSGDGRPNTWRVCSHLNPRAAQVTGCSGSDFSVLSTNASVSSPPCAIHRDELDALRHRPVNHACRESNARGQ